MIKIFKCRFFCLLTLICHLLCQSIIFWTFSLYFVSLLQMHFFGRTILISATKMGESYRPRSFSFSGTNSNRDSILRTHTKRSSSSDRYRSKMTSTFDTDHSENWGPLIRKVPLSCHLKMNKIETKSTIDQLLSTFSRQRTLSHFLNKWRAFDLDNDHDDNIHDDDNIIDEKTLELIKRTIESKKPCLFLFFESIAYENGHLGARIVESCLLGLQKAITDHGEFMYF